MIDWQDQQLAGRIVIMEFGGRKVYPLGRHGKPGAA